MQASEHPLDVISDMVRHGIIVSIDGARAVVKCGDVISPALPWFAIAGAWLVWLPPSQGAQVTVICPDGDIAGGIIINGIYSDATASPVTNLLSALLKAPDDATFVYDAAAHALTFTLPASGTVTIVADGGFDFQGDTKITGTLKVTDNVTLDAQLDVAGDVLLGEGAILPVKLSDNSAATKVKAK